MKKFESSERVAFTPGEFAALFGKSQTWGYRQIYAGKVKVITEYGRTLIAAAEVDRLLASAGIYNGREKPKEQKARLGKLPEKQRSAWQRFIESKRSTSAKVAASGLGRATPGPKGRKSPPRSEATQRVSKSWQAKQ